jgi:hypothetical protein
VAAEAIKAFERSDWVPAARLLREAIVHQPTNVTLHYYLAIAATHLDLREEAIREFQWVLTNAPAGSAEALAAKQWLTAAGVLAGPATATAPEPPAADAATGPVGGLHGQVVWNETDDPISVSRLQLFLRGIPNTPTHDQYYVLRTQNDGRFNFAKIVPGGYKLTNRVAGKPHWRLRVDVAAGQPVTIDLNPQNSTRTRDDFPEDDK